MAALAKLQLIQFRAAYNLAVHAGIEAGIFARHGLAVETAYTPGSGYLTRALKDGRFDIGHTAADDVIADIEEDANSDLFIFMGLHSGLFALIGSPDVTSIDSLAGKRIGVDSAASGFGLALERMLRARGLSIGRDQADEIGGWEARYRALLEGKISATLLTEPFVENALAAGCRLLARENEIAGIYQGTCGVASRRWAERNRDVLIRYIRAYVRSTEWCFAIENRRSCLELLARHNDISGAAREKTLMSLCDGERGLYPKAAVNMAGIAGVLEIRAEMGYMARPVPPAERYVDRSYYREAVVGGSAAPRGSD